MRGMDKNDPRRPPSEAELDDVNQHWDEETRDYDPGRGDHVDHLNDTTVPTEPQRPKRPKTKKHWGKWLAGFAGVLVVAGGVYYWFMVREAPAEPPVQQQTAQQTPEQADAEEEPVTITPRHYDSGTYLLGLDYPDTWKLSDTETKLTITSPAMLLTDAAGKDVTGQVVLTIRNRQTALPEFSAGPATAVLESQKIAYKKPTQNQRAQTYLSFLNYSGKPKGLDAIYVTGDNGYKVAQSVPMTDVVQTEPLVTVSFVSCANASCSGATTALSLQPDEWSKESLSKPVLTTLESLMIN
jgi:hypothetical protein